MTRNTLPPSLSTLMMAMIETNFWLMWKVKSLSRVLLFAISWNVAYQVPQSMEFSRQKCQSGLPFSSPGDLTDPGIKPVSPSFAGRLVTVWATREGLGAGWERDDRGWDGWMASLTLWMWVWMNSRSWWWTGRPGMLWFMGLQRVRHDWATELN